jgi:hypothetical protein
MKIVSAVALLLAAGFLAAGCGKSDSGGAGPKTQMHRDVPPHGGTPVALGDDYNLELVRDADAGTLSAYVLDDEMEDFIRSGDPAITIVARVGSEERTLVLAAVANPATGETVGSTSLFQVQADWLKTAGSFEGKLRSLTIRGSTFTDVSFNFPSGTGKD